MSSEKEFIELLENAAQRITELELKVKKLEELSEIENIMTRMRRKEEQILRMQGL